MNAYGQPARPDLLTELRRWIARNRSWYLRRAEPDSDFAVSWLASYRYATAGEIAAMIVDDPALREALTFLASPQGQLIEQVVAQQYLSPEQAELLTKGLTLAWKTILDENRPVWQRADVLAGTGAVLAVIGAVIWANKHAA